MLGKIKSVRPEKVLIFQEMERSSSKIKEFFIFPEMEVSNLNIFPLFQGRIFQA